MSRVKRQEFLDNFFFNCECPPCKYDWPTADNQQLLERRYKISDDE